MDDEARSDAGSIPGRPPAYARLAIAVAAVIGVLLPSAASAGNLAVHWTQMAPASSPPARFGGTLAYDAAHHAVVLFGGAGTSGAFLGDTWLWNGTNWTKAHPATRPPARIYQYMAYDSTHHDVVMFGGQTTAGWVNDTWIWDGTTWTLQTPATSPANRASSGGISDDPDLGGLLLYGGYDQTHVYYDTWKWNGTNWIQVATSANPPGYDPALAYSSTVGGVVAFGGGSDQTWAFGGTNWVQRFPAAFPPPRYENGMATVGKGDAIFGGGYGGSFFGDTWYYNGASWSQLGGPSPSARGYISLAFDLMHKKVVLFGGLDSSFVTLGDTWTLGP